MTYTLKLPLLNPVAGVTATHDNDSETIQFEFEEILTV